MAQVNKVLKIQKVFSYSHGMTNLSFTLTLDKPTLKSFLKCLAEAQKDIVKEIEG